MNQVTCECGFTAQGGQEEQVIGKVLEHVRSNHPELVDNVTPEVVRGWIEIVPS